MSLFPYQVEGSRFLAARRYAYLADDPGLGKTAQVVTAAAHIDAYRILVIPPASLKRNWQREFERWGIARRTIYPTALSRLPQDDYPLLCIVNYDVVVRKGLHAQLAAIHWDLLVCDEAHTLKTPTAKRTRAVLGQIGLHLSADHVWLVSGTPAPNHPGELYPALASLYPAATRGLNYDDWLKRYCVTAPSPYGMRVLGNKPEVMSELRPALHGFLLKRKAAQVLTDLPPLRIGRLVIDNDDALEHLQAAIGETEIEEEMALLEAMLSDDADEDLLDAIEDLPLSTLRRLCGEAKVRPLLPVLHDLLTSGDKLVLMCWHKRTMDMLHEGLAKYGVARIDGSVPNDDRQPEVDRFQEDPTCQVFIGQILAAGVGHTLTASHHLLIVEPSWVPGENAQAILRIHRISQQAPCLAQFVALADSIDEIIMRVAERKAACTNELYVGNDDRPHTAVTYNDRQKLESAPACTRSPSPPSPAPS